MLIKGKKQRHNMTHVEIMLGDGEKTIGARWNNGTVGIFDSYKFVAKSFHSPVYYFKSIDTWLLGLCKRYSKVYQSLSSTNLLVTFFFQSFCPRHLWLFKRGSPSKKSRFSLDDLNKREKNKKKTKNKKKKKKIKGKSSSVERCSDQTNQADKLDDNQTNDDQFMGYQCQGYPAEELIGEDNFHQNYDSCEENDEDDEEFVNYEYEILYEKFNTGLSLNNLYECDDRLSGFNPMKTFSSKRVNSTTSLPSQYTSAEIKAKKYI
jgi:hypothetical protein